MDLPFATMGQRYLRITGDTVPQIRMLDHLRGSWEMAEAMQETSWIDGSRCSEEGRGGEGRGG